MTKHKDEAHGTRSGNPGTQSPQLTPPGRQGPSSGQQRYHGCVDGFASRNPSSSCEWFQP